MVRAALRRVGVQQAGLGTERPLQLVPAGQQSSVLVSDTQTGWMQLVAAAAGGGGGKQRRQVAPRCRGLHPQDSIQILFWVRLLYSLSAAGPPAVPTSGCASGKHERGLSRPAAPSAQQCEHMRSQLMLRLMVGATSPPDGKRAVSAEQAGPPNRLLSVRPNLAGRSSRSSKRLAPGGPSRLRAHSQHRFCRCSSCRHGPVTRQCSDHRRLSTSRGLSSTLGAAQPRRRRLSTPPPLASPLQLAMVDWRPLQP